MMLCVTARKQGLGDHVAEQRKRLGLSQSRAARTAGVSRTTWINWEKGTATPEDYNYVNIENVVLWQYGSVAAILAGGEPTELPEAATEAADPEELVWAALRQKYEVWRSEYGIDRAWAMLRREVDEITVLVEQRRKQTRYGQDHDVG